MTSGDEAGALTDSENQTGSDADAHEVPAPAEPDPGGAVSGESTSGDSASGDIVSGDTEPADASSDDVDSGDLESDAVDSGDADSRDVESDAADSDDEDPDDGDSGADEETGTPASAGVWAASVAVLCALLIAGLVIAGMSWSRASDANATSNGQQAAISAARTAVTDLTTADYRDPNAYSAKLKPLSAGQFLSTFGNSATGFKEILVQGKVQTTGKVMDVGVQKFSGTTAQLAVLAYVTVKNTQTPSGSQRAYRLNVSMVESGSKWLVSNVEFVQ
jgi:Mce-associated membrane protein